MQHKVDTGKPIEYNFLTRSHGLIGLSYQSGQSQFQIPRAKRRGPNASLYSLLTFNAQSGLLVSLSAEGHTFSKLDTQGYYDLNKYIGMDYFLSVPTQTAHGGSPLSADIDFIASLPNVLRHTSAPITVRHSLGLEEEYPMLKHSSSVSVPLLKGQAEGIARISPYQRNGMSSRTLGFEIRPKNSSSSCMSSNSEKFKKKMDGALKDSSSPLNADDTDTQDMSNPISRIPTVRFEYRKKVQEYECMWRQSWNQKLILTTKYVSGMGRAEIEAQHRCRPFYLSAVVRARTKSRQLHNAGFKVVYRGRRASGKKTMCQLQLSCSDMGVGLQAKVIDRSGRGKMVLSVRLRESWPIKFASLSVLKDINW